jgi:tetratricopeptide (TPR) repeat protein
MASALRQGDLEALFQNLEVQRTRAETGADSPSEIQRRSDMHDALLQEGLILGGDGVVNLGRTEEAIRVLQRAVDLAEKAAGEDPNDASSRDHVASGGIALANILRHKNPHRALDLYDQVLRRLSEVGSSLHSQRVRAAALANSFYPLRSLGRTSEARQRIDAALAILRDTRDYPAEQYYCDGPAYAILCALADAEAEAGDIRRGIGVYEQLLDKVLAPKGDGRPDLEDAPRLSRLYEVLARMYRQTGDMARADDMQTRRGELWRHWAVKFPNNAFVQRQLQAAANGR